MTQLLENECSQVPVTALETWGDLILVGQGFFLRIIHRKTTELISSSRVFAEQSIHGFEKAPGYNDHCLSLVIWGGRSVCLRVITYEYRDHTFPHHTITVDHDNVLKLDEWIFDAAFRPSSARDHETDSLNYDQVVLVTAHNKLFRLRLGQANPYSEPACELEFLFAGPRCILYSATLQWLSATRILVTSGTAFGEIVVWSLSLTSGTIQAHKHFVLTGHEGSIFGVRVSDQIQLEQGTPLRLLSSCSDDRTIRIWNISDLSQGTLLAQSSLDEDATNVSRTTGFLNYVSEEAAATSDDLCIASAMGHLSRIWDMKYTNNKPKDDRNGYVISIVSFGEDATCQTWQLRQKQGHHLQRSYSLSHRNSASHHAGKNIWSSYLDSDFAHHSSLLTGGADGKVVNHTSLLGEGLDTPHHVELSEWEIEDALRDLLPCDRTVTAATSLHPDSLKEKTKSMPDCFRNMVFVTNTQFLITTTSGHVLIATLDPAERKVWTWKLLASHAGLEGYSITSQLTYHGFEYVFLGDSRGNIYYFHSLFEKVLVLTNVGGKITKIMPIILPQNSYEDFSMVITRHGNLPPMELRITLGDDGTPNLVRERTFPNNKGIVTSCALATLRENEQAVIFGCRDGSVVTYPRETALPSCLSQEMYVPNVHGKEAVTSMVWLPYRKIRDGREDYSPDTQLGWLFSVGRDGTLAVHLFTRAYPWPTLVHQLALPFGPNIEGVHVNRYTNDVSVWGFTSKYFIYHNVSAMDDIFRIECGGAHRVWTFYPSGDSLDATPGGSFAWLKQMKLNISKVNRPSHSVIQAGGHGRETRTCAVSPKASSDAIGPLIATGAEDTDISLFYYADWQGPCNELVRLSVLRKHVTGVQSLQWCERGEYLFSCGGFEEFFVWRIRPIPGLGIGAVCESVCPREKLDSEIRLMDFTVRRKDGLNHWERVYIIGMVFSDSSIKDWQYNPEPRPSESKWSLIATGQYTTACLTQALFMGAKGIAVVPLVVGSTDGHLSFWGLGISPDKLICDEVLPAQRLHQSSIKALAYLQITTTIWLVATGGDDNALTLTIVSGADPHKLQTSTLKMSIAHAAGITALTLLSQGPMTMDKVKMILVSASNDQKVKMWQVNLDLNKPSNERISVTLKGNYPSAVADISSMSILHDRVGAPSRILVCGVGMEVWKHSMEHIT